MIPRSRLLRACLVALVLAVPALAGCGAEAERAFVERRGDALVVQDEPFRFVGVNLYDAAASDVYSCSPSTRLTDRELDEAFQDLRDEAGATVVRFWAYQTYTAGGTDFQGVDRVIAAARGAGLRVLPVLEDGPGDCSTGERRVAKDELPGDAWYVDGYRSPYGSAPLSFRDYAAVMARRYRDDPTVLGWMMMNEAETSTRDADDRSALVAFAEDVGSVIRAADPNHLITLGTQSNGAPGTSGRDFSDIYGLDVLDFAEVHDWGFYGSDTEAVPGSDGGRLPAADSIPCAALDAQIACSFARAGELGKPLVVGEAGITAEDDASRARRAELLGAKVDAAFEAGVDGYLLWHLSTAPTDGYDVQAGDPLFDLLARTARTLGS